jgi:hypothetical protein
MGEDPDAAGPLVRAPNVRWSFATALESVGVRGEAVVGSHGGPGGLRDGLLAFGLAIRHQVRSKASAIPGGDPAFRWASSELFGRIALRGRGLRRWIPDPPEEARLDLAFEAALAPRVAWARANDLSCGDDDDWKRALERVTGRPASPTRTLDAGPLAEDRAATLRGMILAALLEEHLLLRHGYAWWESISAVSVLKELWICERGETAESVARSLGLGTMDPSMIADAFRP